MNTCVCVYIVMFFGSNSFLIHLSLKKTDKVLMLSFFYCIFHVCKQGIFFFICECRICLNSSFCVLLVNLLPIFKSKLSNTIIINGYKGSIQNCVADENKFKMVESTSFSPEQNMGLLTPEQICTNFDKKIYTCRRQM